MNSLVFPQSELMAQGSLWPSAEYDRQLAQLQQALERNIYLVSLNVSEINITVTLENKPVTLLDVVPFSKPQPDRHLFPHMLILSDGRGINLGRVLRISAEKAFQPEGEQILYTQTGLVNHLLFHERQLSAESIADTSRQQLARLLGQSASKRIE